MELKDRFLKYVSYDTQSSEQSRTFPSTDKQLVLLRELADEMKALGMTEVTMDAHGYVMGTVPASKGCENAPVIGFIAHVDTSPDMSGKDVRPRTIEEYDGGDIVLNGQLTMRVADFPELAFFKGHTLIHTDGTTLLGADDKAGVAEIMTAAEYLLAHPEIAHGKIRKQRVARAAHRGHATCQLLLGAALKNMAHDGAPHGVIELLHQRTRIARRNRLARTAQVHVHIDEAWHEIRTCQVDDLGTCRRLRHSTRPHPRDETALNGHGHVGLRLHMFRTIQDGRIDKQRGTIGRRHIELLPLRKLEHLSIIIQCSPIATDISVNGGKRGCGGRNTLQSHPSDTREVSRSVTDTGLLGPLLLQIKTFGLSRSVTVTSSNNL